MGSPRIESKAMDDERDVHEDTKNVNVENERDGSEDEETVISQFARLYKFLDETKQKRTNSWDVVELINNFTIAYAHPLTKDEETHLIDDMRATADMLEASQALMDARNEDGKTSDDIQSRFINSLHAITDRAAADPMSKREKVRDIFVKIGLGLSVLALGATTAALVIGLSPFVIAGCLLASVITLAASVILQYHQTNHTFFGQSLKNHSLMVDMAITESSALEPSTPGCCG